MFHYILTLKHYTLAYCIVLENTGRPALAGTMHCFANQSKLLCGANLIPGLGYVVTFWSNRLENFSSSVRSWIHHSLQSDVSSDSLYRNDGSEFGGSIYQKVNDKLETAVNLAWTAGSNSTRFGIAAKYQLDKDATISVSHDGFRWMSQMKSQLITSESTL